MKSNNAGFYITLKTLVFDIVQCAYSAAASMILLIYCISYIDFTEAHQLHNPD